MGLEYAEISLRYFLKKDSKVLQLEDGRSLGK